MGHPNEDFLKKFLASKFDQPEGQRRLPGKKEIKEQYAAGKHIVKTDKLDEFLKGKSEFILSRASLYKAHDNSKVLAEKQEAERQAQEARHLEYLKEEKIKRQKRLDEYYAAKEKNPMGSIVVENVSNTLTLLGESQAKPTSNWIEKRTPHGIFFYNKEENVWMNNVGIIKKN